MPYCSQPRFSASDRNSLALSRCSRSGMPRTGHSASMPRSASQPSLASAAWVRQSATDVAEGGSSDRWKPATQRVQTSIARVSQGRWIGARVSLSTTMTSTSVWSIWISESGQRASSDPATGTYRSRAALRPSRLATTSRPGRARSRAVTPLRPGGVSPRAMHWRRTSATRSTILGFWRVR